jgi:CBS domain-containing protein
MKVSEVMTRGVEVIHPQAGLPEAAMTMRSLDVGSRPVVKDGRLEGILTDRDIAIRAVAEGRDLATTLVSDVRVDAAFRSAIRSRETASRLMADAGSPCRCSALIERSAALALVDLAVERRAQEAAGMALEGVSEPGRPSRSGLLGARGQRAASPSARGGVGRVGCGGLDSPEVSGPIGVRSAPPRGHNG